ncbi:hypothetical protein ACP70R_038290 [Stipagrostis hirtigluma subsp. patula]
MEAFFRYSLFRGILLSRTAFSSSRPVTLHIPALSASSKISHRFPHPLPQITSLQFAPHPPPLRSSVVTPGLSPINSPARRPVGGVMRGHGGNRPEVWTPKDGRRVLGGGFVRAWRPRFGGQRFLGYLPARYDLAAGILAPDQDARDEIQGQEDGEWPQERPPRRHQLHPVPFAGVEPARAERDAGHDGGRRREAPGLPPRVRGYPAVALGAPAQDPLGDDPPHEGGADEEDGDGNIEDQAGAWPHAQEHPPRGRQQQAGLLAGIEQAPHQRGQPALLLGQGALLEGGAVQEAGDDNIEDQAGAWHHAQHLPRRRQLPAGAGGDARDALPLGQGAPPFPEQLQQYPPGGGALLEGGAQRDEAPLEGAFAAGPGRRRQWQPRNGWPAGVWDFLPLNSTSTPPLGRRRRRRLAAAAAAFLTPQEAVNQDEPVAPPVGRNDMIAEVVELNQRLRETYQAMVGLYHGIEECNDQKRLVRDNAGRNQNYITLREDLRVINEEAERLCRRYSMVYERAMRLREALERFNANPLEWPPILSLSGQPRDAAVHLLRFGD